MTGPAVGSSEGVDKRGQRLLIWEVAFSKVLTTTSSGAFLIGFALALGATPFHIGLLTAAPFLGGLGQLFANHLLQRLGSHRGFCLVSLSLVRCTRVLMILLPWALGLGLSQETLLGLLLLLLLVGHAGETSTEVVRLAWAGTLVGEEERGRFFSQRNRATGMAGIPVLLVGAFFIDWRRSFGSASLLNGFQWLLGGGVLLGLVSLLCVALTPDPHRRNLRNMVGFWYSFRLPFVHYPFRNLLCFYPLWSFSTGLAAAFFDFYMLRFLGMKYVWVVAVNLTGELVSLCCAGFWGRLVDRFGARPVLLLSGLGKAVFPWLWLAVMPDWWPLLFAVVLVRSLNSAMQISFLQTSLRLTPEANRAMYLAMLRSLTNLSQALSRSLAGVLAGALESWEWSRGRFTFQAVHLLFLLSGILRLASLFLLRSLHEPEAVSSRQLLRRLSRGHPFQERT